MFPRLLNVTRMALDWFQSRRAAAVLGACLASAVLLRLSFPVPGWFPLAWVALVPWLVVLRTCTGREAMGGSVVFGLAAAGLGFSWQFIVTAMGGTGLVIYVGAYFVAFAWLLRAMVRRFRLPLVVAAPVLWVGVEHLRSFALTGLPWYYVGHSQVPFRLFIQMADVFGAYALSFVVVAANAAVAEAVLAWRAEPRRWTPAIASGAFVAVLVGGALGYGAWRLPRVASREGPRVGLVQGNIEQDLKNENSLESIAQIFVRYRETTRGLAGLAGGERLDLAVWPESMVQLGLNAPGGEVVDLFRTELLAVARTVGCPLLVGAYAEIGRDDTILAEAAGEVSRVAADAVEVGGRTYRPAGGADPLSGESPVVRIHVREGQRVEAGDALAETISLVHNSAYLIRPDSGFAPTDRYDKNHLVPFGEYVPVRFMQWIVSQVVPFHKGFSPGRQMNLMQLGPHRFGTLICFEDAFPYLLRKLIVRDGGGADFIINISNDGWFQGSHELDQHLGLSRMRAIEFRTGIVRCCNTGISVILDPDGSIATRIEDRTGRFKNVAGVAVGRVRLRSEVTFYARHGDILGKVCLGVALLILLDALWTALRRRRCRDGVCEA